MIPPKPRTFAPKPYVLFDVDGTVSDGQINREGGTGDARPGIYELLEVVHLLGYDIHLWSACGAGHARHVAKTLRLPFIADCHDKPHPHDPYKLARFGRLPALMVDDSQNWLDFFKPNVPTLCVKHAFAVLHPGALLP